MVRNRGFDFNPSIFIEGAFAHMFLDTAKIVSLTQLLHRHLKPELSSRYTWWLYSLIEILSVLESNQTFTVLSLHGTRKGRILLL